MHSTKRLAMFELQLDSLGLDCEVVCILYTAQLAFCEV
jgi:hypothetical protein